MANTVEIKNMAADDGNGMIAHVVSGSETVKIKPQKTTSIGVSDGSQVTISFKAAEGYEEPEAPYAKTASEVNLPSDTTVGERGTRAMQVEKESEQQAAAGRQRDADAERERANREKQLGHASAEKIGNKTEQRNK